jgi:DNA-binding NtrC family response regulator
MADQELFSSMKSGDPLPLQVKLLKSLEESEVRRSGASREAGRADRRGDEP